MTSERPLREVYLDYLAGRLSFEEVKRATDRAVEARERRSAGAEAGADTVTRGDADPP